jgi:hypothetical protein
VVVTRSECYPVAQVQRVQPSHRLWHGRCRGIVIVQHCMGC